MWPVALQPGQADSPRILEGNRLRCPGCETLGDPGFHFKPLAKNERYGSELATIWKHQREKGGCGHLFAPMALAGVDQDRLRELVRDVLHEEQARMNGKEVATA